MCFGAASWQSTAPHAPLPTHTFRQHLRKCAENRFRTSFGCLFCGYAGGASTTQTHSEPIRKGGSKAPPPNATADRSGASLAIWRLSLVIYSSAPASQAKNGPTNKKPRQGHQPLKRQPSMEEQNATFVFRSCGALATFTTLPPLEHQTQHNERTSKKTESFPNGAGSANPSCVYFFHLCRHHRAYFPFALKCGQ